MSYQASEINKLANGLWHDILPALTGIHHSTFRDKHQPCPSCGGTDRFRFDDLEGRGTWYCGQCGGRAGRGGAGDGLSLIMRINGWTFPQTVETVGRWLNAPETDFGGIPRYQMPRREKPDRETDDWEPLAEQPEEELHKLQTETVALLNPKKKKVSKVKPNHLAIIRDQNGVLRGAVVRFEINGKKIPCQVMWCVNKSDGELRWVIHGIGAGRPLYGAETIGDSKFVILVQGERKRDIAAKAIAKFPVVSIVGGDGAVTSMDLTPLHGKTVLVWPDNDWEGGSKNSGMRCAKRIGEMLNGKAEVKIVNPPGDSKPTGWDLGDAFTTDGWTAKEFNEYVAANKFVYAGYDPGENELPDDYFSDDPIAEPLHSNDGAPAIDQSFNPPSDPAPQEQKKKRKKAPPMPHATGDEMDRVFANYIRFLGYDGGTNYYYSFERNQVISMSASAHTRANLIMLMPEEIWKACFPEKTSEGEITKWSLDAAIDQMCRRSSAAGIYDSRNIRNGGCWWDDGRVVMHMGGHLMVDGVDFDFRSVDTKYIYQSRPSVRFLTSRKAEPGECKFIDSVAKSIHWSNPSSAMFVVGWSVLAPICGLLKWRPHLWINGSSGCGKSTILKYFVKPLQGGLAFAPSGSSTEAGIRQSLNGDAVSVIVDEAEGSDLKSRERIQKLIELARISSDDSSSMVARGTSGGEAQTFNVRSMFGFAAVNQSIKLEQDLNRTAILELKNPSAALGADEAARQWKILKTKLAHIDEALGQRMICRILSLVDQVMESVDMMKIAVSAVAGNPRLGDTYGTLLAGYWMLLNDLAPTEDQSMDLAKMIDWDAYIDPEISAGGNDAEDCISAILQVQVRGEIANKPTTATIGELIHRIRETEGTAWAADGYMSDQERKDSKVILGRYGIRVDDEFMKVANKTEALAKGLREGAFGSGWSSNLLRIKGAVKCEKVTHFAPGIKSRCVDIPWESVPIKQ